MKKFLLVCFSFVFATTLVWAQERVVSGRVTAQEDGSALPGVNIVLRGTTNGTVTDADGNFKLSVPSSGGTLVISFIGFATQEVDIGERTVIDFGMSPDTKQLSEVVITAQGIARDKKALGYAVSSVDESQIAARPVNDISRVLQGKIPGVIINPSGGISGTGASINIRGYSTLTGSSQPLWVVDGVPFSSATNAASGFTTGGAATASSRFLDLDPNTIENISVLKGLAATVLYGDQGRNGVILVTTKSGSSKKKSSMISVQQSISSTEIASWPKLQNNYGNGFQQASGVQPAFFSNWGSHFDEIDSTGHPFQFNGDLSRRDAFPGDYFRRTTYAPQPDPIGFFRKGLVSNTNLNFQGGTDKLSFNASVSWTSEQGYTPGNDVTRLNISTGFTAAVTSKFTIRTSLLYANTDLSTPPLNQATGGGAAGGGIPSLYANFLYTPRSVDILNLPFETPGDHKMIFYRSNNDIPSAMWIAKYTRETDETDRFFNSTVLSYDFTENMSLSYKVGFDTYTERQNRSFNKGIGPTYANIDRGVFQTQTLSNTIWNHDLIFTLNKELTSDIHLLARVGGNARNDYFIRDGIYSETQTVFGLFRHSNFESASARSTAFDGRVFYRTTMQQRYGVYGDFSFDFKNYLFLNLAGRNDWSSTLEKGNNSLFYPSASVSFVPTEAFSSLKSDKFNFLKLRLSYGTSAGFAPVYTTRNVVDQNLRGFINPAGTIVGEQSVNNQLGNPNLKAELQQELEAGFEAKFFDERVGIDFTVYDRSTRDLITSASIDPSTGFTSTYTNVGKLQNRGIEIGLTSTPVKMGAFEWNVIWNFTAVRPKVIDLGGAISEIPLSGFTTLGNFAVPGRPMNIIKGSHALYVPAGNGAETGKRVVNTNGLYVADPNIGEIGDPNPQFLTTLINTFSYKGFSLTMQWDYRHGGMMFNSTANATIARGTTTDTDYNRDLLVILPGSKIVATDANGVNTYAPNNIVQTASNYGFGTQFFTNEVAMFDGTVIRLRELALAYNFPNSLLGKTPFKGASLQVNGNNLWFNAVNVPKGVNYDPEVGSQGVDNGIGFDYLTGPSVRRYGVVLKLTF